MSDVRLARLQGQLTAARSCLDVAQAMVDALLAEPEVQAVPGMPPGDCPHPESQLIHAVTMGSDTGQVFCNLCGSKVDA